MKFFDTHCHLAGSELEPEAELLAGRAVAAGVVGMALIAADEKSLEACPRVAKKIASALPAATVVFTAGIHPHDSEAMTPALWTRVEELVRSEGAVAVGETGLDYFYDHSDRDVQRDWFARHIALACDSKKPLVIHCRNAAADVLSLLDVPALHGHPNPGILHCFTEDAPTAHRLLDLGFRISFSGILSFRNAEPLREVARSLPLEKILIETDAPWLAPIPFRGKRNEPAHTRTVFDVLCSLRSESPDLIATTLWQNSCDVYGVNA